MIDPRTRRILQRIAEERPVPGGETVDRVRLWYADLMASNGVGPDMWRVDTHFLDEHGIRVRVLLPTESPLAVIVYYHGGGWIAGSIDTTDTLARKIAERTGCAVVVPDYRLAPEYPWPAAASDAFAALKWASAKTEEILGNAAPLVVAGEGVGGNLAVVAALQARDAGVPSVGQQILISPILTCDSRSPSTAARVSEVTLIPDDLLVHGVDQYVPDTGDRGRPHASPLCASSLQGLPPTVLLAAEYEPLGGEATEFAERLSDAEVPVQLQRYAGLMHGAFSVLQLPIGERPFQGVVRAARAYAARPDQPFPRPADRAALVEHIDFT